MSLKKIFMTLTLFVASTSCASGQAGYYRVWQGFQKPDMTTEAFQQRLPWFMNETRSIYTGVLNNYIVAIPPAVKPTFIPDEFALVVLESEQDYQNVRATDAGKAYGQAHWQVFNQENSKSAAYTSQIPDRLQHNQAYDVMGTPIDWNSGTTTFFIGLKKDSITADAYMTWLSRHIKEVAEGLKPYGLKGYVIIANDQYEVAFMNWESTEARNAAFASPVGLHVRSESETYMNLLMFQEAQAFDKNSVTSDRLYNTGL